jgi:hypothetical protein
MAGQLAGVLRDRLILTASLLAILLVGVLVTGGFYAVTTQDTAVRSVRLAEQARFVAELGLREATSDRVLVRPVASTPEQVTVYSSATGDAVAVYTVSVQPVADTLALVTSEGRVRAGRSEAVKKVDALVPLK